MEFNEEMRQLISKSLPEATANEMKKFIEEATATKKILKDVQAQNEALRMDVARLKPLEQKENELSKKEKELADKERSLSEISRNLEMEMLKVKLQAANESNGAVMRLVDKVFGHPNITVYRNRDVITPSGTGYTTRDNVVDTETTCAGKV